MFTHKCKKCGQGWSGRLENPKQCVYCKSYDWRGGNGVDSNGRITVKTCIDKSLIKKMDMIKGYPCWEDKYDLIIEYALERFFERYNEGKPDQVLGIKED